MSVSNPWPADKVERWPTDKLVPYVRNARTHSDAQIAQIAGSIREWGWTMPVLADEAGGLIAGHCRVLAARKLGLTEIPVMVANGWTEAQKRAYVIADNKLTLNAGWDADILKVELTDLKDMGADLALVGFSEDELAALLADRNAGLTDPDDAPEPLPEPVSALGDVWVLGRHRLMCGDSTSQDDVVWLTQDAKADICFTSPPYAQQRDYKSGGIKNWDALMRGVFSNLPVKHDAQVLVNLGLVHSEGEWTPYWETWIEWMRSVGWRRFGWYVWDQGFGLPGDWNGRLAPSHEFVFHFNHSSVTERARKTKAKNPENIGSRVSGHSTTRDKDGTLKAFSNPNASAQLTKIPDSVVRVTRHTGGIGKAGDHPAVFPVDLVSEMLTAFSDPNDAVYEPFSGSGTQIISAQKNGRSCYAMEIAPEYVDVAIRRWEAFTGQTAKLEETGQTFAETAAQRGVACETEPNAAAA